MLNEVLKEITRNKRSGGCIYLIKSVKPDESNLLTVSLRPFGAKIWVQVGSKMVKRLFSYQPPHYQQSFP